MSEETAGPILLISDRIDTDRLVIRDSRLEECEKLQELNEASDYIGEWVGWKTPKDYAFKTLTEGNLPLDGRKEYFRAKTIILKETDEIIGVVEVYHGYPIRDSLCIGWMFIHPNYQGYGYAREAFQSIRKEAEKAEYKRLRLGVHMKNWPALRFWHKVGFDRIIGIIGDEFHSQDSNATIILEYPIHKLIEVV